MLLPLYVESRSLVVLMRSTYCCCLLVTGNRVAFRLTENRVPGGGYPEPSEPELSRSNSRNRGYLYPGYPGTRQLFYAQPSRLGVCVDLYIHFCCCGPRLSPLAPADYRPRMANTPIICLRTTRYTHTIPLPAYAASLYDEPVDISITRCPNLSMLLFAQIQM